MVSEDSNEVERCLERMRQGDSAALADLFDIFRPKLTRMIELRIGDQLAARIDANDVMQEAFVDAAKKIDGYLRDCPTSIFVWLRGIAIDRLQRMQRDHLGAQCRAAGREVQLPQGSSLLFATNLVDVESPSRHLQHSELREFVRLSIQLLSDEDREVVLMRHFEGLSNGQVAEILNINRSTAAMRHGRALVRLQKILNSSEASSSRWQ